jgi:hypothetical protein
MERIVLKSCNCINIIHNGFNMSLIEDNNEDYKYLGTIRVKEKISETYPEIQNSVYLVKFDSFFQVVNSVKMKDDTNREIFQSYTTGFEDCRLIDDSTFSAVLLDNNKDWVPQVVLCKFDKVKNTINEVISFTSAHETQDAQKNWIVLNKTNQNIFLLHSYDPLKVISIDISRWTTRVVHLQKVFNIQNCQIHGGSAVFLEKKKKYLICIRVVQEHYYQFSLFITLNIQHKLTGISGPFTFKDPTKNTHYEMCMSLLEDNNKIYASISCNDNDITIMTYDSEYILSLINDL